MIRRLVVLILLYQAIPGFSQYEIKGRVNLAGDWQHQIFLSTINKLDDYYNANPEDIVQVVPISEDGSFIFSGDNLPDSDRFYRLYLIKEEGSEFDACLFVGGDDHNFIHLILNNESSLEIHVDSSEYSPFSNYKVVGDKRNQSLERLTKLIYPSFYFYQIKFPSELQFSQQKHNRDMLEFADTCQFPLVGLSALVNTDMDRYFTLYGDRYKAFEEKLMEYFPNHLYTEDYKRRLVYYSGKGFNEHVGKLWILIGILSCIVIGLVAYIISLKRKIGADPKSDIDLNSLTKQEKRILELILQDKSNKEIAAELFVELSTVKTHINKLYSKIKVSSRKQAKIVAESLL